MGGESDVNPRPRKSYRYSFMRGSASRRPSPSRLTPAPDNDRQRKDHGQGGFQKNRAHRNMLPNVSVGGGGRRLSFQHRLGQDRDREHVGQTYVSGARALIST
jgi:hypothetical protein